MNLQGVVAFQSDRVEDLVDHLVAEMERDERARGGSPAERPFREHLVVIPTANLETYLTFEIAARRGVAAGVEFDTAERFLRRLLPVDDDGESPVRVLDATASARLLVSYLEEIDGEARPDLRPVHRFLYPDRGATPEEVERRRFQLAFHLAQLFEEYSYSRQRLLRHWREGEEGLRQEYGDQASTAQLEIEAWQRVLWQELFGPEGRARQIGDDDGRPFMTLPEALFYFAAEADEGLIWPESVHFFGHSYLPRFFRDLLAQRKMATDGRVALYVMSPSLEHWSHGVAGDRSEDPVFEIRAEESLLEGDEYPLALAVWGRAGRDYQWLLDEVTYDRDDVSRRKELQPTTVLEHFQAMIRDLETAREVFLEEPVPEEDRSLNFWSCAGVRRECEAIASEIWELVTGDETLRFNDIAVVVQPGDRGLYQTHLAAALEQTGPIPFNVIDVEAGQASPVLEAARQLLELPLGDFRRDQLLALMVDPCVIEGLEGADREAWLRWCDAVHIFEGADRGDLEKTYLEQEDRFTWSQGLRRLVLGAFMSQPDGADPRAVALDDQIYLPHETSHEELESLGALTGLADELIELARHARVARRPLGAWMEIFAEWITRYVTPRDQEERRTRIHLLGRLSQLGEGDLCPDEAVGYRTAFDFAMSAVASLEQTRGQYLADGVVISAFRPMRPIPFQVVFVTGLGEGKFPAPDPPDMLDLRRVKSEPHDVNPRYRDQYMFLETLISTRARLYLSWVGRHAITGDALEPASVVHQLREMIVEMAPVVGEDAGAKRQALQRAVEVEEHPLRRYDDRYFPEFVERDREGRRWPNHHREARREAQARMVRRRLRRGLPPGYLPSLQELEERLDPHTFGRIATLLRWRRPRGNPDAVEASTSVIRLQLSDLRRFLNCPLQGSARVVLRIYDGDEEDLLDVDHEPFEADFLLRLGIVRGALSQAMSAGELDEQALSRALDAHTHRAAMAGELPGGVYLEAERQKSLGQLKTYAEALEELDEPRRMRRLRFGHPDRRAAVEERLEPLRLEILDPTGEPLEVEIRGTLEVIDGAKGPRSLVMAAGRRAKLKHLVQGGLEQIFLRAAGLDASGQTVVITTTGKTKIEEIPIRGVEEAQKYLAGLVEELVAGVEEIFFPVEIAEAMLAGKIDTGTDRGFAQDAQTHAEKGVSSRYGPVRRWADVPVPTVEEAREILARRFWPWRPSDD